MANQVHEFTVYRARNYVRVRRAREYEPNIRRSVRDQAVNFVRVVRADLKPYIGVLLYVMTEERDKRAVVHSVNSCHCESVNVCEGSEISAVEKD